MTKTESRISTGKNDYLSITLRGKFAAEYKFDFILLKCFVCIGADLFPSAIHEYTDKQDMFADIEKLRNA